MTNQKSSATWLWVLVVILIILHQDNWFWESGYLVLGFIPIGLFYHACISVAAATTWYLATKFAWPHELEMASDASESTEQGGAES